MSSFFHVTIVWRAMGYFAAAAGLGMVCFFLLGVAVTVVVPKTDTALPVAFGTMLPLAFISDVFFSSVHAPHWLHDVASAFPVAPVARAMEAAFNPATHVVADAGLRAAGRARLERRPRPLVIALAFRWEPGSVRWRAR